MIYVQTALICKISTIAVCKEASLNSLRRYLNQNPFGVRRSLASWCSTFWVVLVLLARLLSLIAYADSRLSNGPHLTWHWHDIIGIRIKPMSYECTYSTIVTCQERWIFLILSLLLVRFISWQININNPLIRILNPHTLFLWAFQYMISKIEEGRIRGIRTLILVTTSAGTFPNEHKRSSRLYHFTTPSTFHQATLAFNIQSTPLRKVQ